LRKFSLSIKGLINTSSTLGKRQIKKRQNFYYFVVIMLLCLLLRCSIIGMLLGSCIAFYIIIGDLSPAIISKLAGLEVRWQSQFYQMCCLCTWNGCSDVWFQCFTYWVNVGSIL